MPEARKLIEELTNAYGPTGFEGPVRDILKRELVPIADGVETDGIGSVIATQKGKSDRPRVMLAAHMDELGLMVKYIDEDGYLKILPLGGWLDQSIINQRWTVLTRNGPIPGLTGMKSVHVMDANERKKVFKRDEMFIDVGATSKKDAETRLGIRPGDPVVPDSRFAELAGGTRYMAKALDDRIGCAALVGVMKSIRADPGPNTVVGVGTVQEEVGLRGAQTSSYQVNPDIGISLEVGVAGDHPGITKDEAQERLGDGPGIFLHDSSMLPNLKLRDLFVATAESEGIPFQYNVLAGYGEDGAEMQKSRAGAPSINVTVPTRYLHSHTGVIERSDFDGLVALVAGVVRRLDAATVEAVKSFD